MEDETRPSKSGAPRYPIPSTALVAVEHPFLVRDISKGVESLGGEKNVSRVVGQDGSHQQLRLKLRPSDPFSRSVESCSVHGSNLLLRVEVPKWTGKKRKQGSAEAFTVDETQALKPEEINLRSLRDNVEKSKLSVVGKIESTHRFRDPPDFVWSASSSKFLQHFKDTILSRDYEKAASFKIDTSNSSTELIPPPIMTPAVTPFTYSYRQSSAIKNTEGDSSKLPYKSSRSGQLRVTSIRYDASSVPTPSEDFMKSSISSLDQIEQDLIARLQRHFNERPIWTRRSLLNKLREEGLTTHTIEHHLYAHVAYTFISGPWRDALIKYGIDPRVNPELRIYQTMSFRTDVMGLHRLSKDLANSSLPSESRGGGQVSRHPNCPEPTPEHSHIFDGHSVDTTGKLWQACDVTDPLVQTLLATSQVRDECDVRSSGWYMNGTWGKARAITRAKIHHLLEFGRPLDVASSKYVKRILDIPDQITDENWSKTRLGRSTLSRTLIRTVDNLRSTARQSILRDQAKENQAIPSTASSVGEDTIMRDSTADADANAMDEDEDEDEDDEDEQAEGEDEDDGGEDEGENKVNEQREEDDTVHGGDENEDEEGEDEIAAVMYELEGDDDEPTVLSDSEVSDSGG